MNDERKRLKELYNNLKADNYDLPEYGTFESDMADDNLMRQLYDNIKADNYDVPDYETFRGDMGYGSYQQPAEQPQGLPVNPATFAPVTPAAPSSGAAAARAPFADEEAQRQYERSQFQKDMDKQVKGMQQRAEGMGERMEKMRQAVAKGNSFNTSEQRFNPATGKIETVHYTNTGEIAPTQIARDMASNEQLQKEVAANMKFDSDLEEAYAERERLDKEIERRKKEVKEKREKEYKLTPFGNVMMNNFGTQSTSVLPEEETMGDAELSMLLAARRSNNERIMTLEKERDNPNFFQTTGKRLGTAGLWDFGYGDIADMMTILAFGRENMSGAEGEAQKTMLKNKALEQESASLYGENDTKGQRWGEITANAIPFVLEFLLTGGGFEAATKAGTKIGTKLATKAGAKGFGNFVLRNTGTLGGDIASGLLMANTTGGMKTAADIMGRHMGDSVIQDENGDYKLGHYKNGHFVEGGKSLGRSIYEGEMANFIEYFTEKLGSSVFDKAFGKFGNWLLKGGAGRVSQVLNNIKGSRWTELLQQGGIQGYPSEVLEEETSILLNALLVGDNSMSEFDAFGWFNDDPEKVKQAKRTQGDILGGMLLSIGAMQAPGVAASGANYAYNAAQYHRFKHNVDKSDRVASLSMTPEVWNEWKERIDNTTNEDMGNVIVDLAGDKNLRGYEKEAAGNYIANLMKMRGYNLRTAADAKDKIADNTENAEEKMAQQSFEQGYDADEQQRSDIAIEVAEGKEGAEEAWDGVVQRINDDADMMAAEQREESRKRQFRGEGENKGALRPVTITTKNGEQREVYLTQGELALTESGLVDPEKTKELNNVGTLTAYDPAEGREVSFAPSDIVEVGQMTTAEQQEQNIETNKQAYIQQQQDAATGRFNPQPGQQIEVPDMGTATVLATDGETVTLQMPDGTQQSMAVADIQQIADGVAMEDYRQRHPEAEQPSEPATEAKGAPETFSEGMMLTVKGENGDEQQMEVIGRASYSAQPGSAGYREDPNGGYVALFVPGEEQPRYIREDKLREQTVDYREQEAEQPAAEVEQQEETPAEQSTAGGAVPAGESAETAAAPAVAPEVEIYNNVKGEYPEAYRDKVENTVKIKAKRVAETKTALDKATAALTATEYGSKEEATAKQKRDKAQQAYDAAVADSEMWNAVKSLKDQELLAEREAKDAVERKERERRRAETEAARKREQEAYEAEMARRKAEQEEKNRRAEAALENMAKMRDEAAAVGADFPIEDDADAMEVMNDLEPHTLEEVAAWLLSDTKGKMKIDPEEMRKHTGYSSTDMNKFPFIFKEDGVSPEKFGEHIEQIARENGVPFNEADTNAGFNALLNVLGEVGGLGDLNNYIKDARRVQAERLHSQNVARAAAVQTEDDWIAQHGGMSREEYASYINWMEDAVEQGKTEITDEEFNQIFNTDDTRTATTDEESQRGGAAESGTDGAEARQAATAADDTRGDNQLEGEPQPAEQPAGEVAEEGKAAPTENADKPLKSLAEVKKFMQSIGYKDSMSRVMTDDDGKKFIKYYASGNITPNIYLGETTPFDIWQQFHLYGNVMDVDIPADIKAELDRVNEDARGAREALWAEDREQVKNLLTEAGIPFYDVIDSERGSRIVFTDRKNDNGNYVDYMDVADVDQAREDIAFVREKAERVNKQAAYQTEAEKDAADNNGTAVEQQAEPVETVEVEEAETPKKVGSKIDDVGEKIGGARKDLAQQMSSKINLDADTFPKMFPKFDLKKMVEQGLDPKLATAVYFLRMTAQEEYKRKSKRQSKTTALGSAKFFAAYAKRFLENGDTNTNFTDEGWVFTDYGKKFIDCNLALFDKVHEKLGNNIFDLDLSGYAIYPVESNRYNHYYRRNKDGVEEEIFPAYNARAKYSTSSYYMEDELDKAIEELTGKIAEAVSYKESHPYDLKHYYNPSKKDSDYVGVKLGGKIVPLTDTMPAKDLRRYMEEHEAELQEKARRLDEERKQGKKEGGSSEGRWKPELNLGGMRSRVGEDYRNGRDVSADEFRDTFGFRGVEFGNYVTQKERQKFLNEAYDALLDLAALLDVSPKALSLGGQLGFAIGARGGGKNAAHYEPELNVINLTKTQGAGALAHEWWHALDYYFNREGDKRKTPAMANKMRSWFKPGQRDEIIDAFVDLVKKINDSDYFKRSEALESKLHPNKMSTGYYDNPTELGARAFQDYVARRLTDKGQVNDFLSSFTPEEKWNGEASTYPYPTGDEANEIDEKFDNLFSIMQEKTDDAGNVLLYHKADSKLQKPTAEQKTLTKGLVGWLNGIGIKTHAAVRKGQEVLDKYRELARALRAYHGSGADFEQFDHSHMGEGEGAQAYGYGTYVTEVEGIGKTYADDNSRNVAKYKGNENIPNDILDRIESAIAAGWTFNRTWGYWRDMAKLERERGDEKSAKEYESWAYWISRLSPSDFERKKNRILYTVEIPDDNGNNYLEWDKKQNKDVREKIQRAVDDAGQKHIIGHDADGQRIYEELAGLLGSDKAASEFLHNAGFVGIKYPAEFSSGGRGDKAKNYVIFDEGDLKITDKIRFQRAADGGYEPKPVFYSNAMNAVEGIKQEKATAEQWLAMLQKNGGLKAGEDKWIGLSDWLNDHKGKSLTKQEVLDYIRENQIQVEEVEYANNGDYSKNPRIKELRSEYEGLVAQGNKEELKLGREFIAFEDEMIEKYGSGWIDKINETERRHYDELTERYEAYKNPEKYAMAEMVSKYGDDFELAFETGIDGLQPVTDYYSGKISEAAKYYLGINENDINETRLNYTTDGLDNKREIALTIPTIEPWNEGDEVHFGDAGEGRAVAWVRFGDAYMPADGGAARREFERIMEDNDRWYAAHPKFAKYGIANEGEDLEALKKESEERKARQREALAASNAVPNTVKVLVIDEIQSKRHQEGREKGYKDNSKDKAMSDYTAMLYEKYGPQFNVKLTDEEDAEYQRLQRERMQEEVSERVPDAPFEKNWHEVAFKRMLRYAAENGYDKVAWTKGDQQAERYNIGNAVERIYIGNANGRRYVNIKPKDEKVISIYYNDNGIVTAVSDGTYSDFRNKPLSDVLGKELALKVMSSSEGTTIEGEGLRIGSEGMKGFYDQILPRFADKYGKKWNVKTTDINLPNIGDNGLTMHSVDVTPEMKASVLEGQPMFFRDKDGEVIGYTLNGEIYIDPRYAKPETPVHEYAHLIVHAIRANNPQVWERWKQLANGEQDVIDFVKAKYPEYSENEDDFWEEVISNYTGREGGKRLEDEMRKQMRETPDIVEKARIAVIFHKLRDLLKRFWDMTKDIFSGSTKGIDNFKSMDDVVDLTLAALANKFDPRAAQRAAEEKTLMGVHNISEEKLRKALKQGGFANPSMAVIDTKHHMHNDYGEISLIPKSSLIDARTGKNAGTFTADAWTPSYPQTRLRPTSKGTSKFYKDMQAIDNEVGSELGSKLRLYFDSYLDSRDPDAMYWWYLYERGKNPNVATHGNVFGKEITDKVMGVLDNGKKSLDDLSKEEMSQLVDIYHEYKRQKGEEVVSAEERIAIMKQRLANATGDDPEMQRRRERILNNIKEFEKYGEFYSNLDNFVDSIQNTLRRENELDHYTTFSDARKRVENEGLKNDFNKWLEEINDRYGIESYVFNGYDYYGNQKWVKNTLKNVSRLMKQEGLNGATGVSGIGNWIARVAKKVKTLDQIRAEKGNLKATQEEHDAFRSKWADILYDISRKLDENDTFVGDNRMSEALDHANPADYIKQEYGIDLPKKDREAIDTFIKEVRETFPTGYFETKFERPVMLDEFAVAVVPEGTSQDVVDALKGAGLDVRTYDGTSENRQAVTLEAVRGRDDIRFQKEGEQTRTDAFKNFFGDWEKTGGDSSKVVDEEGKPLVVYHGTFDRNATGQFSTFNTPAFFSSDEETARIFTRDLANEALGKLNEKYKIKRPEGAKGYVYPVYLNIRKPKYIDFKGKAWGSDYKLTQEFEDAVAALKTSDEYDGVIALNIVEGGNNKIGNVTTTYVVKNPSQIKSATGNNGDFDPDNNDIYFRSLDPESDNVVDNAEVGTRPLSDREKVAKLEAEPKVKVYRSMQLIDGKLYPPMSAKSEGQLREPSEIGVWEEADERPDLADNNGKFTLNKGNGKSLKAAYNPYIHTSRTMLNDQFSEAQNRPNLVVVEMEVPESELTSDYKAEKAKDSVGAKQWKAGVIQGQLSGTREVILSRWAKPVRIVPDSEVAANIAEQIDGQVAVMPSNVVTPSVRAELEKLGVQFVETDNTGKLVDGPNKGKTWASVYGKKANNALMREGDNLPFINKTYEEGLAEARAAGYTKKQFDAMVERSERNARKRFADWAEKLNLTDKITFVDTIDELEGLTDKQREQRRDKKGWYNPRTDKIVIILDNHHTQDDVLQTILHEGVAHHGLRAMFGKYFDDFLDNVYAGAEYDIRLQIAKLAKNHGWNIRTATEEYLATLAENTEFESIERSPFAEWWSKIKHFFLDMLHKLGIKGAFAEGDNIFSDNELRYILWRSYQNLVNPGRYRSFVDTANDVVMQDKLKVGDFAPKGANAERKEWQKMPMAAEPSTLGEFENGVKETSINGEYDRREAGESDTHYNRYWQTVHYLEDNNLSLDNAIEMHMQVMDEYNALEDKNSERAEELVAMMDALDPWIEAMEEWESYNGTAAEGDGIMFREGDGAEDILNDRSMDMHERMTAAAARLAENNAGDANAKNALYKAIGGNLADLRKAMGIQKEFDRTTVKRVADLAKILIKGGYLDGMSKNEVSRLLSAVYNATGKADISGDIRKVMDIMVESQLRNAENALRDMEKIKASKVDAKGVEVQGALDVEGQQILKTFKETRGWSEDEISQALADAENRMASDDQAVADEAAAEYAGLQMALDYVQNIHASKVEERELKQELDDERHATDRSREYEETLMEAIQQNKVERIQAYHDLMQRLGDMMRGSIEAAREFKEADKERVREIQHNANSDMEGRPSDEHYKPNWKDKLTNNTIAQFVFSPLSTFDQMLRLFGSKSANGEGYLYNRFMRGWVDAREKEIRGVREKYAVLDAKVKSLFGNEAKSMGELIRKIGNMPKMNVEFWDGGEMKEHTLTQGNLMYIYMVNQMLDGRMKLRKMGIDEKMVDTITRALDPRLIELADWMQNEFLVETRNEYNETHKRMFGAPMAAIENYFPLKILANARVDKPEDLDNFDQNDGISTKTGSIIKRRRNALALDITGANALNVILDHVAQMEHWNAFAEFNRDLNTLRTYKRFRNQVKNMNTIYGSGDKLWQKFNDVAQMASGSYRPKRANLDAAAVNFAKGVTAAKVSFRIFTALKQFLSMPAYIPDARPDLWAKNLATPWKAWNWAMDNLPIFEERWKSRMAGDPRLLKSELDWKGWRNNVVQIASRIGMSPNAFVDALTVSIGAKTIYETRKARYLKEGYSEEQADKRAKQDAEVVYNQTQQSSEGAFLSPMQVDRSWLSVMFTVFRNASMAYQRQLNDAVRNLKRDMEKGNKAKSIEFMAKQMERDGVDADKAQEAAEKRYNRQIGKDVLRVATFGYILQLAWNLGAKLPYLLFGDDDDKKKEMMDDVWAQSMFGWGEGLTGGDVFSQAGKMAVQGKGNPEYLTKEMPIASDIKDVLQEVGNGKYGEVVNDMVNLAVQIGIGMNPQSITDAVLAVMDACGDDPALAHEAMIAVMRILQVPQSQIKEMYFDEVGLSGDEVSNYTPEQLARRYAEYKVKRGYFTTPWNWNNKELIAKEQQKADKAIKERTGKTDDKKTDDEYSKYQEQYKEFDQQLKEYRGTSEYKNATPMEKAELLSDYREDNAEDYAQYDLFKSMDATLTKWSKYYLNANTDKQAQVCKKAIEDYKKQMVAVMDATNDEQREAERKKLAGIIEGFYKEYGNLMPTRTQEEKLEREMDRTLNKIDDAVDDANEVLNQ